MDKLERYVRDNREDFDTYEVSDILWKNLEKQLPKQKIGFLHRFKQPLRIAAGIIFCVGLAYLAWNKADTYKQEKQISNINPHYARLTTEYTSLIENKRKEILILEKENPQLYCQFGTDLHALEENYRNLKAELPANPNQEELLKAMIQNLQLQINLLNQQLEIIQRIKQSKNNEQNNSVV